MLTCLENFMAVTNSISSNQRSSSATNRRLLSELQDVVLHSISFRDLKPLNTLLDRQMNANLFDFGVVREGPKDELTHVSTMQSKPFWNQKVMQPKQSISSWHALIRLNDIQRAFNIDLEHIFILLPGSLLFKYLLTDMVLFHKHLIQNLVNPRYGTAIEHLTKNHKAAIAKQMALKFTLGKSDSKFLFAEAHTIVWEPFTCATNNISKQLQLVHSSLLLLALSHKKDPRFQLVLVPKLRAYASKERPEDIDTPQPVIKINTNSTGTEVVADSTATLATASIVIKMVDSVLLSLQLFRFGDKYRTNYPILLQQHREKMCKAMKDISDARA
ncbi:retrovirus-related pol polyprotein from transposon TNT 1-94, partial [Tanacetum coccineum]